MSVPKGDAEAQRTAVLLYIGGEESLVFGPYEVGQLVKTLPTEDRHWDPQRRCWVLHSVAAGQRCVDTLAGERVHIELLVATPPQRTCRSGPEHLLRDLPPRLRRPAARALAKVLHPDAGGDHESMVELNSAMERHT